MKKQTNCSNCGIIYKGRVCPNCGTFNRKIMNKKAYRNISLAIMMFIRSKDKDPTLRNEGYDHFGYKLLTLNENDINDEIKLLNKIGILSK